MNDLIATIEQMQAEARDGMKRASRDSDPYLYQYLVGKFHAFGKVAGILKKQKEPHFTKRNALFDKCVENCDPEIMKRVSDEVDEMLEKEQKPAEWNEEDENSLEYLHELIDFGVTEKFFDAQTAADMREWLNTMLKSLKPQPKQEWSEEDEKTRKALIWHLKADVDFVSNGVTKTECLAYLDKQKAQKQEWSEEDKRILKGIIGLIDHNQHYNVSNKEMLEWLKSLRPQGSKDSLQTHWKPSEHQIKTLKVVTEFVGCRSEYLGEALVSLIEDLEKL